MVRWVLVGAALVLLVGRPLVELFSIAADELSTTGTSALERATAGAAAVNSAWLALSVAVLAVVGGAASAFVTERSAIPGRKWLRIGFLLPLLVPPFVSALSWVRAYGPSGLSDDAIGFSLPGLFGPAGIAAVIAVNAMPVAYLITAAALNTSSGADGERSARASGAGPGTSLATVTVPLLRPALMASGLLSAVAALNSFGVPAVLGTPAGFSTITTRIYQDLARSSRPESFTRAILLACGLVIAALILSVTAEATLGRTGTGSRTAVIAGPVTIPTRNRWWPLLLAWVFVAGVTIFPLMAMLLVALTRAVGLAPVPANWTTANFEEALTPRFLETAGRSLVLAIAAATGAVVLGTLAATVSRRRGGGVLAIAVLLTFAVPGSTLAVAVLLAYGPAFRDTLLLILIAYLAKLWAVGHRSVLGSIRNLPPELMWAARAGGAGPMAAVRTVMVPLLRPALFGGWLLVFLFAFHELTMSSLLYGPGSDTLAVMILNLQQVGDVGVSTSLAVMLTIPLIVIAIPLVATGTLSRRLLGTE
jgi:iron(III) transport system permease protein